MGRFNGLFGMLRIAVAALLLVVSAAAYAESVEEKAVLCDACHGLKGIPEDKSIPIIWGQNAGYLYLQFRDFQKGARTDERMSAVAKNVVKEDALALAEFFAAKPWPSTGAPAASKADADAAKVAIKSVVCTSCHLEEFQGDLSVPRLAGQQRDYLLKTMTDFRSRAAGQQPRDVGPDEHRHARAADRDRRLSRWYLSGSGSLGWDMACSGPRGGESPCLAELVEPVVAGRVPLWLGGATQENAHGSFHETRLRLRIGWRLGPPALAAPGDAGSGPTTGATATNDAGSGPTRARRARAARPRRRPPP